jgi:hypothetical protein
VLRRHPFLFVFTIVGWHRYNGMITDLVRDKGTDPELNKTFHAWRNLVVSTLAESGSWKTRIRFGAAPVEQTVVQHQTAQSKVVMPKRHFWEMSD